MLSNCREAIPFDTQRRWRHRGQGRRSAGLIIDYMILSSWSLLYEPYTPSERAGPKDKEVINALE